MAPSAFRSRAVTGLWSRRSATTIRPSLSCRSSRSRARQKIAMTSEATVMSNPSSRGAPLETPPRPLTMERSARSFMSSTRRHRMRRGSMPSGLSQNRWLSSIAASRLCAAVMAWKSPVKCRLIWSIGPTCARPPPVAPPLMPKQGPRLGSRRQIMVFVPRRLSASPRPMVVVVLPSPAGVGLMPVTSTSRPAGALARAATKSSPILALKRP